jgi:hypothetical protein
MMSQKRATPRRFFGSGGLERTGGGPRCRGGVLARQGDRRDERRGEGDASGEQESEPQAAGLGGHRGWAGAEQGAAAGGGQRDDDG